MAPPLKLYGTPLSPNVVRVATVLNELDLDFEIVPVDISTGAHKQPDFLALNPFGQIPVLVDVDGQVVYESRAINRHLTAKHDGSRGHPKHGRKDYLATQGSKDVPWGRLIPPRGRATTRSTGIEVWLDVEAHQFAPAVSPLVHHLLIKPFLLDGGGAPAADPEVVDTHTRRLAEVLDVYDAHLAKSKYLAGDEFTLADANHMAYLLFLSKTPKAGLIDERPHVKAWWDDIAARPAFNKTVAAIPFPPLPAPSA